MMKQLLLLAISTLMVGHASFADQPNILWVTSEDNSPYLGCYGDKLAVTPNLDKLAEGGLRYRNAFATSPVCSAARTTLISGMNGCALGVQHHRSSVMIPERFQQYPEVLRAAGYYCTNNSKTDYNTGNKRKIWDDTSKKAHFKNRAAGQPFFAVFNFVSSHESQVAPKKGKTSFRIPHEKIPLPPYHPDTTDIRRDWANYYDQMTVMDQQVGDILDELEKDGLAEDTIVFYYGDHGGALPRGKRNIHDSGTRVPFIVRIPKKWQHLAPAQPGDWVDDPVCFVDFPATVFSLCGVKIPDYYQGKPFLGEQKVAPRDHVFLFRGRMDERYDTSRSVRDRQYGYVRNYSPHRPCGQHYSYPFQVQPSMRSWFAEFEAGRCDPVQSAYWLPKASEELYEIASDPFEIKNLMGDASQAARIVEMRAKLRADMVEVKDTGFIPEGMFEKLAGDKTLYDYAQSDAYPIERVIDVADLATSREAEALPKLVEALSDANPVIRYWGATGCLILQDKAAPAKEMLQGLLKDEWNDIRVVAAEALGFLGEKEVALTVLADVIKNGGKYESLAALNTLDFMWKAGNVTLAKAQDLVRGVEFKEPLDRVPNYLLSEEERK